MSFQSELSNAFRAMNFDARDLAQVLKGANRLIFIGNGGSAAIASHMATDFAKNGHMATLSFNDGAMLTCLSNDLGYENVFSHPLEKHIRAPDCLIAISSSGKSPNILKGVAVAQERGADIVSLSGFSPDNPLAQIGTRRYHVNSDDYGIVETLHLAILHAALRELPHVQRP